MSSWTAEQKAARMKRDLAKMKDVGSWPCPWLHLKTQPWVTEVNGQMGFAMLAPGDTIVTDKDTGQRTNYASLEELVLTWSVD